MATKTVENPVDALKESVDAPIMCDLPKCLSDKRLPATWFLTHTGAKPECSFMLCKICANNVQKVMDKAVTLNHGRVICKVCKKVSKIENVVLRPI